MRIRKYIGLKVLWAFVTVVSGLTAFAQPLSWQTSNGPYGGIVRDINVDLTRQIIANTNRQVLRSSNGGISWQSVRVSQSLDNYLSRLFVCPNGQGIIILGCTRGVLRSTDNGMSWTQTNLSSLFYGVRSFTSDSAGNIYAGTYREGIYVSQDQGEHWMFLALAGRTAECMTFDKAANRIFAGSEGRMYYSTNSGVTWDSTNLGDAYCRQILIDPSGRSYLATLVNGVMYSDDVGITWDQSTFPVGDCQTLAMDSSGTVYAGAYGVYTSNDHGTTWTPTAPLNEQVLSLCVVDNNKIFAGGFNGIHKTIDKGKSWIESNEGNASTYVSRIVTNSAGDAFAVSAGNIFRLNNNGATWERVFQSGFSLDPGMTTDSQGRIFVTVRDTIWRSSDDGHVWNVAGTVANAPLTLIVAYGSENLLAADYFATLYQSTNSGKNWHLIRESDCQSCEIRAVAIDNGGVVFIGTMEWPGAVGRILRSSDNGMTWTHVGVNQVTKGVSSLVVHPSGNIFCGTVGDGVYRSTDGGDSWIRVVSGLSDNGVWALACAPGGGDLFAGTGSGVFRSTNQGSAWSQENSGLPISGILSVAASHTGLVYAGTQDYGVYQTQQPTSINEAVIPAKFILYQNYPNPANPTTTIRFAIPSPSFVSLRIYDLLGSQVSILVNEIRSAGEYSVQFDGSRVASGVYFYRLQAGEYVSTKRMLLLK